MRVVVIGGGVAGLCAALLVARDGHQVSLLERDPAPPPSPTEACRTWTRRGVNQFRLPHGFLPRFARVLDAELPDVVAALEAAGAVHLNRMTSLPDALTGGAMPGDERFDSITGRRPLVEAALARLVAVEPGVVVRRGVAARGLVVDEGHQAARIPHVRGVVTSQGERIRADLVVDAGGRRSALPDLLAAVGARRPAERAAESGFIYYSRDFRSSDGSLPVALGPPLHAHGSISWATIAADQGHWSVVLFASARDTAVRAARDPAVWERLVRRFPRVAHWADAEPVGGVQVIARLQDRARRFVVDGRPVATGVVAVGDAAACTDPSLGRGATIGLLHVVGLRDALRSAGDADPSAFVEHWHELTERAITPLVDDALRASAHRLAEMEAHVAGAPYDPPDPGWHAARSLVAAARTDPHLLRAATEIMALLARGVDVLARPDVRSRIAAGSVDDAPAPGPGRAELLHLLRRAA